MLCSPLLLRIKCACRQAILGDGKSPASPSSILLFLFSISLLASSGCQTTRFSNLSKFSKRVFQKSDSVDSEIKETNIAKATKASESLILEVSTKDILNPSDFLPATHKKNTSAYRPTFLNLLKQKQSSKFDVPEPSSKNSATDSTGKNSLRQLITSKHDSWVTNRVTKRSQ